MELKKLKIQLAEAIDTRESGDLAASRKLFDKLVDQVKNFLSDTSSWEFKNFYVTVMGEYVIQMRLEGGRKYVEAIKLGLGIYEFNKVNNLKNILAPRSVSHPLQNAGNFEEAEPYLRELIEMTKDDPFRQGEEMAHLSLCLLRTGRIDEAEVLIDKAINQITENHTDYKYFNVPYSRALMYKALILNARDRHEEGLKIAEEALSLAKKDRLPFRIIQAEALVSLLKSKI
jgi:tetratricopeptide (TPR) repeat protein